MSADLTVVVPVRNGAPYLAEALGSLTGQTVPPAAIVVVDDGSSDGSGDIARAVGAQVVRVGTDAAGVGVGAARNVGARQARSELLAFMDADDLSSPERFARQIAALHEYPALDGVLGHVRQFLSPDKAAELAGRHEVPEHPMPGWHAGALLIETERFAATDGWSDDPEEHDAFGWFAVARERGLRLLMLDDVVIERRIHGDNLTLRRREDLHARYLLSARAAIRRRAQGA